MADILVIDQRDPSRDVLHDLLPEYGHRVQYRQPGEPDMAACADQADVIVVVLGDHAMARNQVEELRSRRTTRSTPLIACTSRVANEDAEALYRAGATNVHCMPIFENVIAAAADQLARLACRPALSRGKPAAPQERHQATTASRIAYQLALALEMAPKDAGEIAAAVPGRNIGIPGHARAEPENPEERAAAARAGHTFWKATDEMAALVALRWRECWDGSGVPDGLVGHAIPLPARIAAVADCYERLTTGPQALRPAGALRNIETLSGNQLEPRLVALLGRILDDDNLDRVVSIGSARA